MLSNLFYKKEGTPGDEMLGGGAGAADGDSDFEAGASTDTPAFTAGATSETARRDAAARAAEAARRHAGTIDSARGLDSSVRPEARPGSSPTPPEPERAGPADISDENEKEEKKEKDPDERRNQYPQGEGWLGTLYEFLQNDEFDHFLRSTVGTILYKAADLAAKTATKDEKDWMALQEQMNSALERLPSRMKDGAGKGVDKIKEAAQKVFAGIKKGVASITQHVKDMTARFRTPEGEASAEANVDGSSNLGDGHDDEGPATVRDAEPDARVDHAATDDEEPDAGVDPAVAGDDAEPDAAELGGEPAPAAGDLHMPDARDVFSTASPAGGGVEPPAPDPSPAEPTTTSPEGIVSGHSTDPAVSGGAAGGVDADPRTHRPG